MFSLCVCVSVYVWTMTFEQCDLRPTYLTRWFNYFKFEGPGHTSKLTVKG